MYRYVFSFEVNTFLDFNGINLITYITFINIYTFPLLKWKSKENFINLFKFVLFIINNDTIYHNKNLCIIIGEMNTYHIIDNVLAQPLFINVNNINSAEHLFNLFKWNSNAFNDNIKNIVITIKIL